MPLRDVRAILSMLKRRTHPPRVRTLLRKMHMLTWFGLGFWALVWVGACSKSSLGLTYSKLFLIDNIVSLSGPGILDFGRYKMGCLQIFLCEQTSRTQWCHFQPFLLFRFLGWLMIGPYTRDLWCYYTWDNNEIE